MALAVGDKRDMAAMQDLLANFDAELATEYAARTGGQAAQMTAWMDAETWFLADEAKEHGFVDEVVSNTRNEAMAGVWNLSCYRNAPAIEPLPTPDWKAVHAHNQRRMQLFAPIA
jgi:1,4-dihydroxy-2-naphthoyl-CoA synthase